MWNNAEVVSLVDQHDVVRAVSRNEDEAPIRRVIGRRVLELVREDCLAACKAALKAAREGRETELLVASHADDGYVFWSRVRIMQCPSEESWVLVHARRLPRSWALLSGREQEIIVALHETGLNPKRAARQLGVTMNTFNAHRRSICRKCKLNGVGDFWVFVERCR